jgi:uncharacterized protein (DUF305 family)
MRTTRALAALTVGLALILAGCGSDPETAASESDHNDADVAFASGMIQHHAQALSMVDLTMGRELDPKVQKLTEEIRAAQAPEIETMADWLDEWDEPIPATVRDHVNSEDQGGHDMGDKGGGSDDTGMDMPGMMSEEAMAGLEGASGAEFQDMWLSMMIEHHEGAVEMAQTEQADGKYQPAIDLAKDIETSQTAEIATMQGLLS